MKEIEFMFPSAEQANDCMRAIDKIARWEVARQYGGSWSRLWITEAIFKESSNVQKKVVELVVLYGGKEK